MMNVELVLLVDIVPSLSEKQSSCKSCKRVRICIRGPTVCSSTVIRWWRRSSWVKLSETERE